MSDISELKEILPLQILELKILYHVSIFTANSHDPIRIAIYH